MAREQAKAATPQWAYLFAALCGAIPVVTLGGAIPAAIGFGGAGGCISISRSYSVPSPIRFFACLGITLVCWLALLTMILEFSPGAKQRFQDMFG